jgi:hypothetical protein
MLEKLDVNVDGIYLAQDRGNLRAFVNTMMNIQLPKNRGKFLSC